MNKKIVLAYSGGLDTSVCVRWLADRAYEVIAFAADVGQGGDWAVLRRRALAAGASKLVVRDLRAQFAKEFIVPALQADAVYEGKYTLATALSRPLIASALVDAAHRERATTVAHGCTGKGNDQVRFEVAIQALDPRLKIVAPVREWELKSREAEVAYARRHRIPIDVTKRSLYSIDENLWGISIESGPLEDPRTEPPADAFRLTRDPSRAPSRPAYVRIGFERGAPVRLNGRKLPLVALIAQLNRLGGQHGIGRTDLIENRLVGIKSREVYEAPAATILLEAHQELERLVLDRELYHYKQHVGLKYAELIYFGLWFTPLKNALDAFVAATQRMVTGEVKVKLYRGQAVSVGRTSPHSRYAKALATYTAEDAFDQRAAEGFIKLWGLPYRGGRVAE